MADVRYNANHERIAFVFPAQVLAIVVSPGLLQMPEVQQYEYRCDARIRNDLYVVARPFSTRSAVRRLCQFRFDVMFDLGRC
jgi:hypothetical protein